MNNINYIIIFTLIIGLSSVRSGIIVQNRESCETARRAIVNPTNEVDRLIFNQFWSPTFCYELSQKKSENLTSKSCSDKKWLIGGLWPSLEQKTGPAFCDCSAEFDEFQLSSIITDLESKWVNIHNNHTFLNSQWIKHGTCGANINGINNQFNYFNKSLELLDKFNIYNILINATITPGNKYPASVIEDALKLKLGKKSQLRCILNRTTHEFYLGGVRLCFDVSFNLIDCQGNKTYRYPTKCPQDKGLIIYLNSTSY